ncbi:phospholipase A, partial [Acinetobacter nosocomialis]|nr:phospholipase A [Acinetobacter nosocomialis]
EGSKYQVFWTSDKNEFPTSPNPNNTVKEAQDLKSTETKFQISLKTKAWENIFGNNGDLWVGYTQSSRWQTFNSKESRPFRETNYEPEASLMFRTNYELLGLDARLLGVTLNHQSNGRSDSNKTFLSESNYAIDKVDNASSIKVMTYNMTNVQGKTATATAMVLFPKASQPKDGYRVVVWEHGTGVMH